MRARCLRRHCCCCRVHRRHQPCCLQPCCRRHCVVQPVGVCRRHRRLPFGRTTVAATAPHQPGPIPISIASTSFQPFMNPHRTRFGNLHVAKSHPVLTCDFKPSSQTQVALQPKSLAGARQLSEYLAKTYRRRPRRDERLEPCELFCSIMPSMTRLKSSGSILSGVRINVFLPPAGPCC